MNKLFLLFAIFTSSLTFANPPETMGMLSAKAILQNKEGYFVLSDGSLWKAVGFSPRWRSVSEWWNNVQIVPKNYECVPNDWYIGTEVEVYSKYGNIAVNEADASNQDVIRQCTHLLANTRTGQVLFAISLHPADGLVQIFNDAHKDGYNQGHAEGKLSSYKNASEAYNNGYSDGYKVGYAEGIKPLIIKERTLN